MYSKREKEVISWVVQGLKNKDIASQMQVHEKTVKFHLTNIYKRAGVNSRAQLLIKALKGEVNV